MKSAYELRDVAYTYANSKQAAVIDFSLVIEAGKTTALLGPNGAGKSTIMDLLLGWRTPDKGEIHLFEEPLSTYNRRALGRIVSLVPQEEISRFSFSVLDYVLFGRSPYLHQLASPSPRDIEISLEALELVGILAIRDRPVQALSGGEHQLVLLARALAQQPTVLLLDEPTSSLDPGNTAKVISIMEQLSHKGITLFFTTHDPSVASECAHNVAMLKGGRLLTSGPKEEVLNGELLSTLYGTPIDTFYRGGRLVVTLMNKSLLP
ncbi:MAG: ABC transporter ATP-binding protein [Sphaerochaetaceae bacterium]